MTVGQTATQDILCIKKLKNLLLNHIDGWVAIFD